MCRECYYPFEYSGWVLSEHKRRAAAAVMNVVVVMVAMIMNSGAVIRWIRMRSTTM